MANLRVLLATGALIAALAALPTARADASSASTAPQRARASTVSAALSDAIVLPPGPITALASDPLDALLGEATLGAGGIPLSALDPPALANIIAERPGIDGFETVKGLKGSVLASLEAAIAELVAENEEVEELVGPFALATDIEEQLEATYEASAVGKKAGAPEFEEAVEKALGREPEEVIDEGLESLTLGELLSLLANRASDPRELVGQLFAASEPEALGELLGAELGGEPFAQATAGEVAAALGQSPSQLAATLGQSGQLPEGAPAFTTALSDGRDLGVFAALHGLAFGVIGKAAKGEEPPKEEHAEPGEPKVEPTPPASEPPPTTTPTTTLTTPTVLAPPAAAPAGAPASPSPVTTIAKLKLLGHKVAGSVLSVTVQAPAAGLLTLRGTGLEARSHTFTHAGRLTLKTGASPSGLRALRRHHRLKVELRATFTPVGGVRSTATVAAVLV